MDKVDKALDLFLRKNLKGFVEVVKTFDFADLEKFNYSAYFAFRNLYLLKSSSVYKGMLKDLGLNYFIFNKMKEFLSFWTFDEAKSIFESFIHFYTKVKEGKIEQNQLIALFLSDLLV